MKSYKIGRGEITIKGDGKCSLCGAAEVPFAHMICKSAILPVKEIIEEAGGLALSFGENGPEIQVSVTEKGGYCRFAVTEAADTVEAFIWGPYYTPCTGECGEIVGVVRDKGNITGIQALNPKTVGGFPRECVPGHPLAGEITARTGMREPISACAALPLNNGAALQAYCRNRTKPANRDFFYAKQALVLPAEGEDALIPGSAIALFVCTEEQALGVISEVELGEELPHTLVDGEWAKIAKRANASYLITDFDADNLDEALDLTETAGMSCLYHPGFFKNWGHFQVEAEGGDEAVKAAVERGAKRGINIGVHTLSNFMTTDDPYVSPVPHPNLLIMGETTLLSAIDDSTAEISVADGGFFQRLSTLNALRIGDELIRYQSVNEGENGESVLMECERGAWGTRPAAHESGQVAARLWDYDYRTLFPDLTLQREFSRRLGQLFKSTGLRRMSFDGLACDYTGHEEYAQALFVKDCYDIWGPEVMSDASGLTHYNWHMHSYMNWGEPWYSDMRNGMFEYRRSNQDYFRRNLFPPMMGWFTLRQATRKYESTTPDDIQWMLSKAAGFGAGFAFNIGRDAVKNHGKVRDYLKSIAIWERMRLWGEIPHDVRLWLQDPKSEWELEETEGGFLLYPVNIAAYECSPEGAQPGMPSGADWMTYNPHGAQKMRFRLRAGDERDEGTISQLTFRSGEDFIAFHTKIACGQYFIYDGGTTAELRDKDFNLIAEIEGNGTPLALTQGVGMLLFKCVFEGAEPPYPQVKVIMRGEPRFIPENKNR